MGINRNKSTSISFIQFTASPFQIRISIHTYVLSYLLISSRTIRYGNFLFSTSFYGAHPSLSGTKISFFFSYSLYITATDRRAGVFGYNFYSAESIVFMQVKLLQFHIKAICVGKQLVVGKSQRRNKEIQYEVIRSDGVQSESATDESVVLRRDHTLIVARCT